ncbi:dodecin family protein [Tamlana sp. 2_MG-2023]|uniref:dodecin n=1 Tax=unclassified Tamlana TaxID=2614803 RepID=UPI0026E19C98|nr:MULTISPECIES: dodecin [unclassified Tamlana]MDO6758962.1 dodecin family protein [Tamlana sp. 2_MG-2023]MDO6789661.1 dodecin family protein [Tamlana sp. 1_MG-2023]
MEDHIYKIIEIVGTSNKSSDDAVTNALNKASKSIQNLRWFEVTNTRGSIEDGKVDRWQVTIRLGFTMNG